MVSLSIDRRGLKELAYRWRVPDRSASLQSDGRRRASAVRETATNRSPIPATESANAIPRAAGQPDLPKHFYVDSRYFGRILRRKLGKTPQITMKPRCVARPMANRKTGQRAVAMPGAIGIIPLLPAAPRPANGFISWGGSGAERA